jgi:hypothetical protein
MEKEKHKCRELDYSKKDALLWKEGDDGLRYKWNKIGEVKSYRAPCKECGKLIEYMPI